jgi:hypothetical protein
MPPNCPNNTGAMRAPTHCDVFNLIMPHCVRRKPLFNGLEKSGPIFACRGGENLNLHLQSLAIFSLATEVEIYMYVYL